MSVLTRRRFVQSGMAMAGAAAMLRPEWAMAYPLGLPLGLQLYSVRELLPKDYEGTLIQLGKIGYREVEAAGFYNKPASEVKADMAKAKLRCVSGHYPWSTLGPNVDKIFDFHKELGADYVICASPGHKSPAAPAGGGHGAPLTIEDWRWNAENFNEVGKKAKAAGLKFGYHNHYAEFIKVDGTVPYDELLRLTDPALVTFEMDLGWVTVGGGDPKAYLQEKANRISMLHVKDFKPKPAGAGPGGHGEPTVLGRGTIDYASIFKVVKKGAIKHIFVEQEAFEMEPFEELKLNAEYMQSLKV